MYKSPISSAIFSRFGKFGCWTVFEERIETCRGSGTIIDLSKINSYEGKIEIICKIEKGNARYLDLLCADTIWKRGREKVESSHWLIFVLFIRRSFPRVFFFSFFPPFLRERENRGSGLRFEAFFSSIFFFFFSSFTFFASSSIFTPRPDPDAPSYFNGRNNDWTLW